jgi:fatty-acyl-CoA synthase
VLINGYPLFHVAGVLPGALCSLAVGMETIIPTAALFRNRDVIQNYWKLVARHRSTLISGVPTALAALAAVPLDGADISSVRSVRTGAAPLPPELAARFERDFGLSVRESLGMTETAGLSTVTPPGGEAPAGCVGWPLPYARVRIVELDAEGAPTDREQPVGQSGMVLYRGPNLFSGTDVVAQEVRAGEVVELAPLDHDVSFAVVSPPSTATQRCRYGRSSSATPGDSSRSAAWISVL